MYGLKTICVTFRTCSVPFAKEKLNENKLLACQNLDDTVKAALLKKNIRLGLFLGSLHQSKVQTFAVAKFKHFNVAYMVANTLENISNNIRLDIWTKIYIICLPIC